MTVQTTSVPNVIDAVLHKIRALSAVTSAGATVYDGPPGPEQPDLFVTVGGDPAPTVDGQQDWMSLGAPNGTAPSKDERYTLDCHIYSFVGGGDDAGATGVSDAQKTARDNAYSIFQAIESAFRTDPVLIAETSVFTDGQGLHTGWVQVFDHRLEQTDPDDERSQFGRYAWVHFTIAVFARRYSA